MGKSLGSHLTVHDTSFVTWIVVVIDFSCYEVVMELGQLDVGGVVTGKCKICNTKLALTLILNLSLT